MIIVAGSFDVAPEQRDSFLESRKEAMLAARTEEGCIDYAFSTDIVDPGRVRLFEIWENRAALDAHVARMRAAGPRPRAVPVIARSVASYETSTGPNPL